MQTGGVPFFTFPSTPPSYIPANSYPYTFAPLPAPPFSISPIQPGAATATVAVPSYTGIAVPQVTAVEPIVTLNSAPALAAGVVHAAQAPTYPVAAAAIQSLGDPGEAHIHNVALTSHANPGAPTAVAVGINGATVNVIQQPVIQPTQAHEGSNSRGIMVPAVSAAPGAIHAPGHDLAVIHTLGPTHQHFQTTSNLHAAARPTIQHVAHAPAAALIQTAIQANDDSGSRGHPHAQHIHLVHPSLANVADVGSQTASVAEPPSLSSERQRNESSIFVNSHHRSRSSAYVSLPSSSTSTPTHSPSSSSNSRLTIEPRVARVPSPSSGDESDSSTSSLSDNFSTVFYPVPSYSPLTSDSDGLESPDHLSDSPNPFSGRESADILSDGSNNMSEQSDSESESTSALHTLANAAAVILADAPSNETDSASSQPGPSHSVDGEPLRLPVLINISGSENEQSRVDTPSSVIDLTTSPTTSTPSSLSDSPPDNVTGFTSSSHVGRNLQNSLASATSASHDGRHLSHHAIAAPLLLPVIQHQPTNVITANLAVTAQRTNAASFSAPANASQVQLTERSHRIQVIHVC